MVDDLPKLGKLIDADRDIYIYIYICVRKLCLIVSDNGFAPSQRQAIIRTNAAILLIWTLETNVTEMLIEIHTFSLTKIYLKTSTAKWRSFCLGVNVLNIDIKIMKWHFVANQKIIKISCRVKIVHELHYCCECKSRGANLTSNTSLYITPGH